MNVEIWTAEDNLEECAEIGVTAVVTFDEDSRKEAPDWRIPELAQYVQRRGTQLTGGDRLVTERDVDTLRLHVVPFEDDLDDPDDWETAGKAEAWLRQLVRYYAADKRLPLTIEGA
jgi:hypothetical protein